jgi:hypothetical protein
MVLDGKIKTNRASKNKKDNGDSSIIDFTTSVDQVKCSR